MGLKSHWSPGLWKFTSFAIKMSQTGQTDSVGKAHFKGTPSSLKCGNLNRLPNPRLFYDMKMRGTTSSTLVAGVTASPPGLSGDQRHVRGPAGLWPITRVCGLSLYRITVTISIRQTRQTVQINPLSIFWDLASLFNCFSFGQVSRMVTRKRNPP